MKIEIISDEPFGAYPDSKTWREFKKGDAVDDCPDDWCKSMVDKGLAKDASPQVSASRTAQPQSQ